ncbi:hypothetical protein QAD02_002764 [Eretmocerus hayati]|uniref:Uncharacterized protein n=1 Tax=Eretmocerus hayati TaxID=131215 RepID=A0ACC2NPQ2_9HYME|nr:hypothetical protein QAD02_002764 [Eretmocerus hayati]
MRYVTGRRDNYRNDRVPTRNYNGSRSTPNFYEPNGGRSYGSNYGYNSNDNRSRSFYNNNANQGRNYEGYNMNRNGNWNNGNGYRAPVRNNDDYNSRGYTQRYNSGNNGRQYNNARSNYNGPNGNYQGSRDDNAETTRQIESSHAVDESTTPMEIDELTINVSERMAIHPLSWKVKEFETQGQAGVQILVWGKGNEPKNGGSISNEGETILINTKATNGSITRQQAIVPESRELSPILEMQEIGTVDNRTWPTITANNVNMSTSVQSPETNASKFGEMGDGTPTFSKSPEASFHKTLENRKDSDDHISAQDRTGNFSDNDVEMPQVEISINPNDISQQQEALSNLSQPQNSSYRNGALANADVIQGNMIQGNDIDRQDEEPDITEAYAHLRTLAAMNLLQGKFRSKRSYDLKINSKFFRVGEMVYLIKEPRHGKTDKHYVGPWEILEIDYNTHNARIIKDGTERIVHIDKLKNHHENEDAQ